MLEFDLKFVDEVIKCVTICIKMLVCYNKNTFDIKNGIINKTIHPRIELL